MHFSPDYIIGVACSLTATIVQNGSLGCMKLIHLNEERRPEAKRREYYQIPHWYAVFIFNIVGVVLDFVALSFLPSSVAMPIGSLGLIVSTIFAWRFAGELITFTDILGITLIIVGSWVSILFSGGAQRPKTSDEFLELFEYGSLSFVYFVVLLCLLVTLLEAHKSFAKNSIVGSILPGLQGTITNIGGKGSSYVLRLTLSGRNQLVYVFSYVLVVATLASVLYQNHLLQRALSAYDAVIVVPIYFVTLCIMCVANGVFFFNEFSNTTVVSNCIFAVGIIAIVTGAILLAQKHMVKTSHVSSETNPVDRFFGAEKPAKQMEEKQTSKLPITPSSDIILSKQ